MSCAATCCLCSIQKRVSKEREKATIPPLTKRHQFRSLVEQHSGLPVLWNNTRSPQCHSTDGLQICTINTMLVEATYNWSSNPLTPMSILFHHHTVPSAPSLLITLYPDPFISASGIHSEIFCLSLRPLSVSLLSCPSGPRHLLETLYLPLPTAPQRLQPKYTTWQMD